MEALELARWQFGITTVYHFVLVPLTIGLSILVAIMQTAWVRTGKEKWLRLTKFYGKLLLINFALGVATGIVQEFQFGMNWSEYSRFVGDIFGAPLAMEALLAFFLESTFLGLWIFGWDRLPKKLHLLTVWLFSIGTVLSAYFIIAANSWMQHPVGAEYNPETGRAEMNDILAVLTNNTTLVAFPHVIATAFLVAGTFVGGIAVFWMVKTARKDKDSADLPMYRTAARFGALVMIISGIAVIVTGDVQAKLMFEQQPIKMAAAEALCETEQPAQFSLLTIGNLAGDDCSSVSHILTVPGLTSYLATGDWNAEVTGLDELQETYAERYGATDTEGNEISYQPNLAVTYWSFRLMIGLAAFSAALALGILWFTRKKASGMPGWMKTLAIVSLPMPYLAASFGWIFTEMGRQPFVVAPNPTGSDQVFLLTQYGYSSSVSAGEVITSLVIFTVVYAILGVFWFRLIQRYAVEGAPQVEEPTVQSDDDDAAKPMSFAY
ncbi:cytochrome ubiquinol oxidase subunit I [Demequina sp. SYSU T00039]|uniref:Cytochrome ubiquinol oxidase subunit I n=1 Tax=Demequina lignilytica TaxID=3051663 RepID=A0AAW7M711_9MICO|nr:MULTISPECIES: cytochrome ubiquinol oxidase subunit I [unclassified Demequina]MDN4478365.1 cytochrome ubiquinol oxidase subunit I [Demequina sp. SYSU T00039-1]MDN4487128.1 cytochrome ubiquinol oxidase subunit I [Demequina sp. SYSU T00039]MDN4489839.1 cytochrome ubiquinol oxidase subunit I [Demequina sp. SYSU T00068]